MSISEKLTSIADNQQKIFEAGQKSEYDRFWDKYQKNGAKLWYNYAFAGTRWTEETFKPKYDLVASGCAYMFSDCAVKNLKTTLENLGLTLDTSTATSAVYMFSNSYIAEVGELDMTSAVVLTGIFYGARIVSVDKLILRSDGTNTLINAFYNASNLENIIFEGTVGASVDMHWSTNLSRVSIESLLSHLSDEKSGLGVTLSLDAVNKAFESSDGACDGADTDEWNTLTEAHSGWTFSLV